MQLTVLVDNNTLIDRYFLGEPGVSYLIEDAGVKVLLDLGYSDAFLRNAAKMGMDLLDLDHVVLSHGHLDHSWGLEPLVRLYTEAAIEGRRRVRPALVAHPEAFRPVMIEEIGRIGSLLTEERLKDHFHLRLSRKPFMITENLAFLGEIPRDREYEGRKPVGRAGPRGPEDFVPDDTALAYRSPKGLVVITGCSHSGIGNIVERARDVWGMDRVVDIVGGLHLLDPPEEQLKATVDYIGSLDLEALHACHCTDLASKVALSRAAPLQEVGVGLRLEYG